MDSSQEPPVDEMAGLKDRLMKAEARLKAISDQAAGAEGGPVLFDGGKASSLRERRYRSLFENMSEGCALHEIVCDEAGKPCDFRFLEINPAFERQTGLKREEVVGKLATEILPGLEPFWVETYGEVALTGQPVQFEHYTHALNRYYRVYAYSPAPRTFAAIFMDITDQREIELLLNEVAEKYFTLFNNTSDGVCIHNLEGEILEVNDAYCRMSGYTRDELDHLPITMLEINPAPVDFAARIQKLTEQEGHDRYETKHCRKDGECFDVDITALYYHMEEGRIALFVRDITVRKQVEARLSYLASFPERNPNPIVEVGMQGEIHYANPTALRQFPNLMEQGLKHDWFTDWENVMQPIRQGREKIILRDVVVGRRWYQQSLEYLASDNLVRIYGIEVTQRKQVEEAIKLSEEKYRTMVETASEGIVLGRPDGEFFYANQQFANMLGYEVDEIIGKSSQTFMFAEDQLQIQPLRDELQSGSVLHGEFKWRRKDGSALWSMYNATPIFTDQRVHTANLVMHTDITARKQVENAIRESERRLNRAEEIAQLGSWELDLVTNHLTWSSEVYRLFGFQPHEFPATYEAFLDAIHPDDRAAVDAAYSGSIREGRDSYEIEHRLKNRITGEVRYVYEKCVHFRDASGVVVRSEGMVHDITERKVAEQALKQARDELEQRVQERTVELKLANEHLIDEVAERQKAQVELEASLTELQETQDELQNALRSELETHDQLVKAEKFAAVGRLLASITHEINNPLQTIKNCLYLTQEDTTDASPVFEYLRMASAETDRLSNLVAQLREIYRPPGQGQFKRVNLPVLLGEVHTLLAGYLHEKHVSWEVSAQDNDLLTDLTIEAIPDQLKQVFLNISLNAIDAMEPGGGSLRIDPVIAEDRSEAGIRFRDTGPGLPQEVKERLFEPFTTTKEKGLGLGLVICYDIIQKHHGQIEVESKPGEGASFTVWLPVRKDTQPAL